MKNRLQLRYHIPESLPTRDGAMEYLKEAFHNGFKNTAGNASLPAEPLVILYNDTLLDVNNGITEAKRLETSNALLAIGRGGDGIDKENNIDYFVIDFAKHTEDIAKAFSSIKSEEDRAISIETELLNLITTLQNNLEVEKSERISGNQTNDNKINEEILRATNIENELRELITNEINRSIDKDTEIVLNLNSEISRALKAEEILTENLSEEIRRSTEKDESLTNILNLANENIAKLQEHTTKDAENLSIETLNRTNEDKALDSKIETLISSEETARKTSDEFLNSKIELNSTKIKENKVSSNNKTINVTGPTENGTNLEVNVDNKTIVINETGTLSVASDALVQYNGNNAITVSNVIGGVKSIDLNINANDAVLSNDINGLLATLSLKWVKGEKDEIQLIGKNDTVISRIDVAEFIKDGMLDSVKLDSSDSSNPLLIFTFNSASGKEILSLNVKDLVDIYNAGHGITKLDNVFSINIDSSSESFLSVGADGLKVSGIQKAINDAKDELASNLSTEKDILALTIQNLSNELKAEENNRLEQGNKITSDYKEADAAIRLELATADANVMKNYQDADALIRADFASADASIRTDFTNADASIRTDFTNADASIRTDFTNADTQIIEAYQHADNLIKNELLDENIKLSKQFADNLNNVRDELTSKDEELSRLITIIESSVVAETNFRTLADETVLSDSKKYTDDSCTTERERAINAETQLSSSILDEQSRALLAEQTLLNKIDNNANSIAILNSDATVNGSIKDIVFDSALGAIVNTVTVENATEQSLLRKFISNGIPYIYVSNRTADIKHNSEQLDSVIESIKNNTSETEGNINDIRTEINAINQNISELENNLLEQMQNTIAALQNEITTLKDELATLKTNAITSIEGTENEIKVVRTGNNATIGFAEDAYFVAGDIE